MLPSRSARTTSSLKPLPRRCTISTAAMIMPGVQKPHCRPWCSRKASCIGCSLPPWARPSMLRTLAPSQDAASVVHDLMARPSTWTTQAPHWLVSQPTCVPVSRRFSRRNCTKSVLASMSALTGLPFTVMLTLIMRPPGVDGVEARAVAGGADAVAAGLAGSGGAGSAGFLPLRNRENMHLLLFRHRGLVGTGRRRTLTIVCHWRWQLRHSSALCAIRSAVLGSELKAKACLAVPAPHHKRAAQALLNQGAQGGRRPPAGHGRSAT